MVFILAFKVIVTIERKFPLTSALMKCIVFLHFSDQLYTAEMHNSIVWRVMTTW